MHMQISGGSFIKVTMHTRKKRLVGGKSWMWEKKNVTHARIPSPVLRPHFSRHQNSAHFSFRFVYAYMLNGEQQACCPPMLDGVVQTRIFAFPSVAPRQAHARILNHNLTYYLYSCKNIFQIFINEDRGQGETLKSHCTIICICSNKWLKNNEEKKTKQKKIIVCRLFWFDTFNFEKMEVNLFCAWKRHQSFFFFYFPYVFTKKELCWSSSPWWTATLLLQPRSYENKKSNIYFFPFEKSGQQLKPALALSVDKSPRPGARICKSGLLRISFGLWSSSSSFSWRDQPAQTWCHSKSAQASFHGFLLSLLTRTVLILIQQKLKSVFLADLTQSYNWRKTW